MPKKTNNKIICEECDIQAAVIIDRDIYKCPECYMLDHRIPPAYGIHHLNTEGKRDRKKN